ncbi:MAG: hypothetical protein QCI38_03095 [Candidatus Thermoplasmatota archaeon]|nr:hypothetical protein [Candidatus Thermoplasmatota archaeon]
MSLQDLQERHPELYEKLEKIADKRTMPFCYLCYVDAPGGRCARCGTDDLMRHLSGVGVEYGYEWVIEHLIRQEVEDISEEDQESLFMDFIDDCYNEETKIAFLTVNTAWAVKQLDPLAFEMALHEYFDVEAHVEVGSRLYSISAIESWAEDITGKLENCDAVMGVNP